MKRVSVLLNRAGTFLSALFLLVLFFSVANAQGSSTLRGIVSDPQGRPIAT